MSRCMNCQRLMNALEAQYYENCGVCRKRPGMDGKIPHQGGYPDLSSHFENNPNVPKVGDPANTEHPPKSVDKAVYL